MTDPQRAYFTHIESPIGPLLVAGEGKRLVAIKFGAPAQRIGRALEALHHEMRGAFLFERNDAKVAPLARQVRAYLEGRRTSFDIELDLSHMTPFRRDVLLATTAVPRGSVASYAEIARRVGRPLAFRAVGSTMRTNPIPIVIPCHRIVGSDGPGGYGGGLALKRQLLALEGAVLPG